MTKTQVQLVESVGTAGNLSGTKWRARILETNRWGSSAYYPHEVVERDGPRVFHTGLQMFQNHLSESEQWDRPEGSVENLVGKLVSDAWIEEDGLYADVEFYPSYVDRISEIHKDIGLSVNAAGLTEDAEMDGRFGPVLVAILTAGSVDVVTRAGAGGKLTSILESDRAIAGRPVKEGNQSVTDLTKEDFEAGLSGLVESISTAVATSLTEALANHVPAEGEPKPKAEKPAKEETPAETLAEGAEENVETPGDEPAEVDVVEVVEALRESGLPKGAVKKVVESIKGGSTLDDAIKAELDYAAELGAVKGEYGDITLFKESAGAKDTRAYIAEKLG
jgi:hypothetical protein